MDVKFTFEIDVFASCSLDGSIKFFKTNLDKSFQNINAEQKGVNCISFYKENLELMVSGGDDGVVKLWNYYSKQCLKSFNNHKDKISSVNFFQTIPFFASSSEDGNVSIFSLNSLKFVEKINQYLKKAWMCSIKNNLIGICYDEGSVVIRMGNQQALSQLSKQKLLVVNNCNCQMFYLNSAISDKNKEISELDIESKSIGNFFIYPKFLVIDDKCQNLIVGDGSEVLIYKI